MAIHIKPSKKGTLHDALGIPRDEKIPTSKLKIHEGDSASLKKKKQFALNASHFKHENGGKLKAAWGAELGTSQFIGGPDPIKPLNLNGTPLLGADGKPISTTPSVWDTPQPIPPTQPAPGTIPVGNDNPAWTNYPTTLGPQPTAPVDPTRPKMITNPDYIPNQGEGQLNRGKVPNLTEGQKKYDPQAIKPDAYKGKDFKAPQSTGLQGSGGQFVLTGLMLADAMLKKDKIRRRYVRPEDMQSYNPNQYGTGSQALSEYGNTLKGKKKAFWGAIVGAVAGEAKEKGKQDTKNLVNNFQESAAPILMTSAMGQQEADRLNNLYLSGGVQNMANLQSPQALLPGQQIQPLQQPYNPNNNRYMKNGGEMYGQGRNMNKMQNYYEQGKNYDLEEGEIEQLRRMGYKFKYVN